MLPAIPKISRSYRSQAVAARVVGGASASLASAAPLGPNLHPDDHPRAGEKLPIGSNAGDVADRDAHAVKRATARNEWIIVQILTQQPSHQTARKYWNKLKERLGREGSESVTGCHRLKLPAADGKNYFTDVANAETLLRLVQSVCATT